MGILKSVILVVILAYLSKITYFVLLDFGYGVHHNNVHPGKCRVIPGITCGSEQISVTSDGIAFITSGYRLFTRCNAEFMKGRLYLFDFNRPDDDVTELKIVAKELNLDSFDPHGMDILEFPDEGIIHMYVVNHADYMESVEVFVFNRNVPDEIVHNRTITDDKFICINDLTLIGEDHFYITNHMKYCKAVKFLPMLEYFMGMHTASVVYYKHGQTTFVASGVGFNGITLSKDKNEVLVAHGGNKAIDVFERNQADGLLRLRKNVFLGYSPDNIFLDRQTGAYYVAYFKDVGGLSVAENRSNYCSASGAMLSVKDENSDHIDVKELFYDHGENFVCAASAFIHYKGQYLLGTIFDKLGYCKKE